MIKYLQFLITIFTNMRFSIFRMNPIVSQEIFFEFIRNITNFASEIPLIMFQHVFFQSFFQRIFKITNFALKFIFLMDFHMIFKCFRREQSQTAQFASEWSNRVTSHCVIPDVDKFSGSFEWEIHFHVIPLQMHF